MKKTAILFIFFLSAQFLFAQSYRTAAGLRLGTGTGSGIALTVQQRVAKYGTIEGIFQPSFNGSVSSLDLMYEHHYKILFKRFNIYMGGGLHKDWRPDDHDDIDKADAGVVGIIGGEITFKRVGVSWDYKPFANVIGADDNFFGAQSAVSLRVILVQQKKKKIDWKFWEKDKSKKEKRQERKEKERKQKEKEKKKKENADKPWWKVWG